ncbi:MAG: hypothetical protein ACYTG5_14015 [Planctomycetota bacterium]|jgi:hypothetical protein
MKLNKTLLIAAITSATLLLTGIRAQDQEKKAREKPDPFNVVLVADAVQVVRKSELPGLKKGLDEQYAEALADYKASMKNAKKNKQKLKLEKPRKAKIKMLKANLKSQEDADLFVEEYSAKEAKKAEKRQSKKKDK